MRTLLIALLLAVPAAHAQNLAANKKAVVEFYQKAINDKDFDAAAKYLGSRYIQHNPVAADGAEGLKGFIGFLKSKFPNAKSEIKRVIAEGDLVMTHGLIKTSPDDRGLAAADIFRLENGKIVEHWDVVQPVPETAANDNTMF